MLAGGIILGWVAYAVGSYGWVLLRGWDIPFRSWVSPLNPYQWPAGGPGPIPDTQLFPTSAAAAAGGQQGSSTPPAPGKPPVGNTTTTPGKGPPTGITGSSVKPFG